MEVLSVRDLVLRLGIPLNLVCHLNPLALLNPADTPLDVDPLRSGFLLQFHIPLTVNRRAHRGFLEGEGARDHIMQSEFV